jgi:hypothetical protein
MPAAVPVVVGVVTAAAAVYGVVASGKAARKQAEGQRIAQRAQERQAAAQQRVDDIRSQRARVKTIRAKRTAVAEVANAGQSSGVQTSTTQGTLATINSQTTSAITASRQKDDELRDASIFNQNASRQAAALYSSSARFQTGASQAAGVQNVASIFG